MITRSLVKIASLFVIAVWLLIPAGHAAVAPVAQLPTVTAGVTPSPYVLPILLVSEQNEWKDFGIQVNLKVYPNGEEQADRIGGNEWEVGVLDPFYAIKAGNEGDVAIVGVAGNLTNQLYLMSRRGNRIPSLPRLRQAHLGKEILTPGPSAEHFFLSLLLRDPKEFLPPPATAGIDPGETFLKGKGESALLRSPQALLAVQQGFHSWPDLRKEETFLPVCLVASTTYADTRKTLVIRWLEGYARGVRILLKNPAKAASRLKGYYQEVLKIEVPQRLLEMEIAEAFFTEKRQEEAFQSSGSQPSAVERFAQGMSDYLVRMKVLKTKKDPGEYILDKMCGQLASLRREAEAQFNQTRVAIEQAEKEGMKVEKFRRQLDEARSQMEEGRGCLTVIGTLSNLMRSAEQAKVEAQRFRKFRFLELGVGGVLVAYYSGYFVRRRKRSP
jgi:ABC-type nitrate/sulfonate/bicarbonate transport system substrate-binding protein